MMDKALCAYLWDDAPAELHPYINVMRTPQMVWIVPARWQTRARRAMLPPALTTLLDGYAGMAWGLVERFHQEDGTLLLVVYRAP